MRQVISVIVLAFCIMGLGGKSNFSINKDDTEETYADNPLLTKVASDRLDTKHYRFKDVAPVSILGINTNDIGIVSGDVRLVPEEKLVLVDLIFNGKENFDKLFDRLQKESERDRDMNCRYPGGNISCHRDMYDRGDINVFVLTYFKKTDGAVLSIMINNN
ncbi:hypothetical protein DM558_03920 [Entomomonas moraniae]|uniref:Uncharacterized protein n=1 Tax=Entomomonas moraniae TaxID=2213226 RepID=A0A3Q9JI41_9GAMM|nr:hypothetical protein [Entomomonas moraniae]AZS49974.1 hypothetical protein DM558_03920 [Entomomonas moraniae]